MFHSGNISLQRWAYLSGPAEPGDWAGEGARGLSDCGP